MPHTPPNHETENLDPHDWNQFRQESHHVLDETLDYLEHIRDRPVWQPMPGSIRAEFRESVPRASSSLDSCYRAFRETVVPYMLGNQHPCFMGWAHGGGTPIGVIAEMLAAALNANLGGRDHAPIEVERQVLRWVRELFGFPDSASGLFVTGTSVGNLIGTLVARTAACGTGVRESGIGTRNKRLMAYASECAHVSAVRAMEIAGLGSDALRRVRVSDRFEMEVRELERLIRLDKAAGFEPFLVVGTAGTPDVGAIDDLEALSDVARREGLWFHVDGAFGALGILSAEVAPRLHGIERADSISFDFHKWGQVPYDAGFVLVRNAALHEQTFGIQSGYLLRAENGMASNLPWPCDLGPDLSRGFRALKTWFTMKVYGTDRLGMMISKTCSLARYMEHRIKESPSLELLAPVSLNIVCFGYRCSNPDSMNARIVVDLQNSGIAAPSTAVIRGRLAIRAAIFNHRTTASDVDALIDAVIRFGELDSRGNSSPS